MNGIEKAEWGAGPGRRDGSVQWPGAAGWGSVASEASFQPPPPTSPRQGARLGAGWGVDGVGGGGAQARMPRPFLCWLCRFFFSLSLSLARADPFSASSVISNNVTASLQSIHQSRKKPILTMIKKKKKKICASRGQSKLGSNRWRPAGLPFHRAWVIRFHRAVLPPQAPRVLPRAPLPRRTHPGDLSAHRELWPGL